MNRLNQPTAQGNLIEDIQNPSDEPTFTTNGPRMLLRSYSDNIACSLVLNTTADNQRVLQLKLWKHTQDQKQMERELKRLWKKMDILWEDMQEVITKILENENSKEDTKGMTNEFDRQKAWQEYYRIQAERTKVNDEQAQPLRIEFMKIGNIITDMECKLQKLKTQREGKANKMK